MFQATQTEVGSDGSITVTEWTQTQPLTHNFDGFYLFFAFFLFFLGYQITKTLWK